jgi:hypothetical protein
MTPATYMRSSGGTIFDGTVFATFAIYFPLSANAAFNGSTFPAPEGVQTLVVTGLAPNAGYNVAVTESDAGNAISVFPSGTSATTDGAGVLVLQV